MANFIEFGTIPAITLPIITSLRGLADSSFLKSLSILVGMLLGPQALSVFLIVLI